MKKNKYTFIPLLVSLVASTFATQATIHQQVLQYDPTTDMTKSFTVPLTNVHRIITAGKYAWALDLIDSNNIDDGISFFDGKQWNSAQVFSKRVVMNHLGFDPSSSLEAGVDGSGHAYAILGSNSNAADEQGEIFYRDAQGHYAWHLVPMFSDMANGRIWTFIPGDLGVQKDNVLEVNQQEYGGTYKSIEDASSVNLIKSIGKESVPAPVIDSSTIDGMHAYHDTKTNTDHFDIYADAIQDGKVFDNHLDIFSCQVPHDSANVAADVRCTSRIVDVSALSPVASVTDFGVKAYWPKGSNTPVISMDTVGSGSEEGMLWSKDNGATWQVATWPSSDDSGMGYLINNFTMSSKDTCPFQASTDTNVSHFLNPPQIHCANLLHNVSTTDLTSYVLNAGDLAPEVRGPEMQYTTGLTGLWMFQKYSQNQNTYYIPFDQTQKQQEIPPAPGKGGLTQMPQFAIVSGANIKPAELVSCTFDSDLSLGAAVATTNGTKWSWKQQGTTVKQENIYDNDCRISMPDHSSTTVFDKPPFQNPRYDASSYVWLFAYQNI